MTEVAHLTATLSADTSSFSRDMKRADSSFSKVGRAIKVGALAAGAGIAYGLGKVAKIGWDEFNQGQRVAAQTNAVLKSTGHIANVTAAHVEGLGKKYMMLSGIDDEVIKGGENILLTFKGIRNGMSASTAIFDKATKATLDMSVAMGKDMNSSAVMVGKALNDPVKGLSALTRVGVTFTDQQEKNITSLVKHGETVKAQKIILRELTTEFGGSARAAGQTLGGQINILRERFNNWAGDMVGRAIPAIQDFAKKAMPFVSRAFEFAEEKGKQFIAWFQGTLLPAIQSVIATAKSLWKRFGDDIKRNFNAAKTIIKSALNVVIGIVELFAAVLRGDWRAAWEAIKKIAKNALTLLITYLKNLVGNLLSIGKRLGGAIKDGIVAGLKGLAGLVGDAARLAINAVISAFNALGSFTIPVPLGPDIHVDFPDIPHVAKGGHVTGSGLAMIHKGEDVVPAKVAAGGGGGTVVIQNYGVLGSEREVLNWFDRAVDRRRRRGG